MRDYQIQSAMALQTDSVCYFAGWEVMEVNWDMFHSLRAQLECRLQSLPGHIMLCMTSKHSQNILMVGVKGTRQGRQEISTCATHTHTHIQSQSSIPGWQVMFDLDHQNWICVRYLFNIMQDIQWPLGKNPVKKTYLDHISLIKRWKSFKSHKILRIH